MNLLAVLFLFIAAFCHAQPTGSSKLYLDIVHQNDTLSYGNCFSHNLDRAKFKILCHGYQLIDVSRDATGFKNSTPGPIFIKTLMTDQHHILLINANLDTMDIEIRNAFRRYYLCLTFQKGQFKMYVNDQLKHRWNVNALPFKWIKDIYYIYDITPKDWEPFRVNQLKDESEYFISKQFEKQGLLAKPIIPEDDPNFRNPRRINNLHLEVADFNFDGIKDYREKKWNDSSRWNYFLYSNHVGGFILDTLLSSMDNTIFDPEKKIHIGTKTIKIDSLTRRMFQYEWVNGEFILHRQIDFIHASPNSEKVDTYIFELQNGEMWLKEVIRGCE